jgi:hypothetical protein
MTPELLTLSVELAKVLDTIIIITNAMDISDIRNFSASYVEWNTMTNEIRPGFAPAGTVQSNSIRA